MNSTATMTSTRTPRNDRDAILAIPLGVILGEFRFI